MIGIEAGIKRDGGGEGLVAGIIGLEGRGRVARDIHLLQQLEDAQALLKTCLVMYVKQFGNEREMKGGVPLGLGTA